MNTKTSEVKAHAEFSASGAERWLNCPGSISLAKKAPPEVESPYAAEGTRAHACLEFILKNRKNLEKAIAGARKLYPGGMVDYAVEAVAWLLAKQKSLDGAVLECETRVDASPFVCEGQFGTLDVSIIQEFGRLTIVDYKYGAGTVVEPAGEDGRGNPQLVYYALGVSHAYAHNFVDVELVVIQPRAYHESGETTRSHVMTMDELLAWESVFKDGVKRTRAPNPEHKPGAWCKYCRAAVICPELKGKAMAQAQIVFSDDKGLVTVPEPKLVKLPNLSKMLDACERLEDWIQKVRDHAEHVLQSGGEIDGFKLVQKRSIRRWVDKEKAQAEAVKKFGKDALTTPELLSPAQLEKKAKGAKGLDAWIEANVTDESTGTTLVRESDKRPAVKPLESVFT
jgi:hypothetical protein